MPDWAEPVARYILQEGLPNTLRVAVIAVVGSTLIGVVLGTLLTIHFRPLRAVIRLYVEVFRGLPILVTVFAAFFLLPTISPALEFSPLTAGTIALTLWGSAQVAETTRGAVQSIRHEQRDAAAALGFGWVGSHVYVILPQALRRLLPPLVSLLVNIIQNTTLVGVIGGLDLLEAGKRQNERLATYPPIGVGESHAFEIFDRHRACSSSCSRSRSRASPPTSRSASWCSGRRASARPVAAQSHSHRYPPAGMAATAAKLRGGRPRWRMQRESRSRAAGTSYGRPAAR